MLLCSHYCLHMLNNLIAPFCLVGGEIKNLLTTKRLWAVKIRQYNSSYRFERWALPLSLKLFWAIVYWKFAKKNLYFKICTEFEIFYNLIGFTLQFDILQRNFHINCIIFECINLFLMKYSWVTIYFCSLVLLISCLF